MNARDWEKSERNKVQRCISFDEKLQDNSDAGFLVSSFSCSYVHSEVSYSFYSPKEKEQPFDGLIAVTIAPVVQSSSFPNLSMLGP